MYCCCCRVFFYPSFRSTLLPLHLFQHAVVAVYCNYVVSRKKNNRFVFDLTGMQKDPIFFDLRIPYSIDLTIWLPVFFFVSVLVLASAYFDNFFVIGGCFRIWPFTLLLLHMIFVLRQNAPNYFNWILSPHFQLGIKMIHYRQISFYSFFFGLRFIVLFELCGFCWMRCVCFFISAAAAIIISSIQLFKLYTSHNNSSIHCVFETNKKHCANVLNFCLRFCYNLQTFSVHSSLWYWNGKKYRTVHTSVPKTIFFSFHSAKEDY